MTSDTAAVKTKTCALVVEDDPNIVDLIRANLAVRGFDTVVSVDGRKALQLLETEDPDIVLLDLMLPEVDGFDLCRQIRERSPVAIIVVSARGGERDKVTALHMGADDYMTKPFSIEELLARIAATLRRTRPAQPTEQVTQEISIGDIHIDLARQQVRRNGQPVHLTPTEFALLRELAVNRGKLLTHAHLLRRVWGHGYETETEYLRVYVRRLRAKLEDEEGTPLILTQPRAGYRLAPEMREIRDQSFTSLTVSSRQPPDVKATLIGTVLWSAEGTYKHTRWFYDSRPPKRREKSKESGDNRAAGRRMPRHRGMQQQQSHIEHAAGWHGLQYPRQLSRSPVNINKQPDQQLHRHDGAEVTSARRQGKCRGYSAGHSFKCPVHGI